MVFKDEYKDFISQIIVEGHTAPTGEPYSAGYPLSCSRAEAVMNYCIAADSRLSGKMISKGYSNSKPLRKPNGAYDMEGSRRVTFRITVELQ